MRTALTSLLLAVLFVLPSQAQLVPSKGTAETLEVATWNLNWFGSTELGPSDEDHQFHNVRAIIEQADIDVWGLQEVASDFDFARLLDSLGTGYDGVLASDGSPRLAYVYRTDVVDARDSRMILTEYEYEFGYRPPLLLEAEVTLPDTSAVITFLNFHAKASGGTEDRARREEAARRLKSRLDFTFASTPVVVVGDYNDEVLSSVHSSDASPYYRFVEDEADYFFASQRVEEMGRGTFCGNSTSCSTGRTYDHILITDELFAPYVEDSGDRFFELRSLDSDRYVYTTSDHLPVYALFDFTTDTAVEHERPQALVVQRPFPNPFRETATLSYTLDRPASVRIDLFDALGRHVRSLQDAVAPTGPHTLHFSAGDLPAGLYLVRFQTEAEQRTFPLVLAR